LTQVFCLLEVSLHPSCHHHHTQPVSHVHTQRCPRPVGVLCEVTTGLFWTLLPHWLQTHQGSSHGSDILYLITGGRRKDGGKTDPWEILLSHLAF
jgi:hypothetical protein